MGPNVDEMLVFASVLASLTAVVSLTASLLVSKRRQERLSRYRLQELLYRQTQLQFEQSLREMEIHKLLESTWEIKKLLNQLEAEINTVSSRELISKIIRLQDNQLQLLITTDMGPPSLSHLEAYLADQRSDLQRLSDASDRSN